MDSLSGCRVQASPKRQSRRNSSLMLVLAPVLALQDFRKALYGFFDVGSAVEGTQTEIALP
ncbi:MAG: hypothetical protein Q8Q58_07225, partial [Candidatus Rokubacteria bacterium]|nr:hypothetical protein [Candidatus Rokubacteria bacterium]